MEDRKYFIKEIENMNKQMYQNNMNEAYNEFRNNVPKIQEVCNEILAESGDTSENLLMIKNVINNMVAAYNESDIIFLADTIRYGLLNLLYTSIGENVENGDLEKNEKESVNIFVNNMEQLKRNNRYIYDYIYSGRIEEQGEQKCKRLLVSEISSSYAATTWVQKFKEVKNFAVIFIFGLSDGQHIEGLVEKCDDTNRIIVYEPSMSQFMKVLRKRNITNILSDKRIDLIVKGINDEYLSDYVGMSINYSNRFLAEFYCLPNYDVTFPDDAKKYQDSIQYEIEMCEYTKNLAVLDAGNLTKNFIYNIFDRIEQYHVQQLKEKMADVDMKNVPAILVAAGPSLDKNIKQLKKAEGRAFIVVVDAALKAMIANDIDFDMGVTADPRKELSLFENNKIYNMPMLVDNYSTIGFIRKHHGRRFYADNSNEFLRGYIRKLNVEEKAEIKEYENAIMAAGGSVANYAFSFLRYLGFEKIILVGQDLAFTEGRGHNRNVYTSEEENKEHVKNSPSICEVEDIYGNKIKTDAQMASYIKWFEKEIYKYRDSLTVIDATEGGAKIRGTRIMSLESAIENFCKDRMKGTDIINDIDQAYSGKEQEYLDKKLMNLNVELTKLRDIIRKNIYNYQKIAEENAVNVKDTAQEIEHLNEEIQNNPLFYILLGYNQEMEYEVNENVYADNEGEIEVIAKKGIKLLQGYLKSADIFEKDLQWINDKGAL